MTDYDKRTLCLVAAAVAISMILVVMVIVAPLIQAELVPKKPVITSVVQELEEE